MDRDEQAEMAEEPIKLPRAKHIVMSYGTAYHSGKTEDWENQIAKAVGAAKIGSEDTIEVNGLLINYRHHVGSSTIPHGRHTAIAKEVLWNQLWSLRGEYPRADVLIRSHVHYHRYAGAADWLAFTTPCLQGYGTKYGGRRMSGTIDLGVVWLDVYSKDKYTWDRKILRMPYHEPLALNQE
jgi:hypothetical protein